MAKNGNSAEKHAARALQRETGMPYTAALAQVRREQAEKERGDAPQEEAQGR